jgi:fructose-1,6-bisphosphatase I
MAEQQANGRQLLENGDSNIITIERFISAQQKRYPQATGTFTRLLQDIALAAKIIARKTTRAGLTDLIGEADSDNVFGERQKQLDVYADRIMYEMNNYTERVCAMASEEHEDILDIPPHYGKGNYVLLFDPLDGSSNIDVNSAIGTIFSIHRKYTRGEHGTREDFLQEGKRLIAAGYVIYGSSTMMVYTTGQGVHGFTLDPSLGEFLLSHEDMRFPEEGSYYNVNHGNEKEWTAGVRRYIKWLQGIEGEGHDPLSQRYTGAMISDFHRDLLKGGIYIYPGADPARDHSYGKIRLMFEAQALAFIAEQAGGYASDGVGDILEIQPHSLHQVVPIFIGNRDLVERAEQYIAKYDQEWLEHYMPYRRGEVLSDAEKRAEEARNNNGNS